MKLYVIGLGPGGKDMRTVAAQRALEKCNLFVGYDKYIALVKEEFPETPCLKSPMTKEIERCRLALFHAASGKTVGLLCSGDPGVYGLSGPVLELSGEFPQVEISIVPGVTAALSAGALLGAPLIHDFAVVSLSDRLTPWETIEKRLRFAALGDFVLCLYNVCSKSRPEHFKNALAVLSEILPENRVCGAVRLAGRAGEEKEVTTLKGLFSFPADMFTTGFIGNSQTQDIKGKMVTPRGYLL
jgi:precorrin-3B C17-methyltransferase